MSWQDSKQIALALLERIPGHVQGRTFLLVDVLNLPASQRLMVFRALRRELEQRGAIVINLYEPPRAASLPPSPDTPLASSD